LTTHSILAKVMLMQEQKKHKKQFIIEAARRTFAREGFHGASIEKIATEAGLKSPSLVYWYFKDKKGLFQAVMEDLSPFLKQMPSLWKRIDEPPEKLLPYIARAFLSSFDNPNARQLFRIVLSEAPREPETANNFGEKVAITVNYVAAYLEHQIELGNLNRHDTQTTARSFMGSFVIYVIGREVFLPFRVGLASQEDYVSQVVNIYLKGLRTEVDKARRVI
jgi:AcrR family transcriptional regulator